MSTSSQTTKSHWKTPVVLSPKYVLAFTVYYGIASLWGLVASWNGIVSVARTGGVVYESFWTMAVMLVSLAVMAFTLTNLPRVEKYLTISWVVVVSVYPTAVIYQYLVEGDSTKAAPSISTLLYLVFPLARYIYLVWKTKKRNG